MAATGREKDNGESQETESGRDGNCRNQFASTVKERNSYDYVNLSGKRLVTPTPSLVAYRLPPASPQHGLGLARAHAHAHGLAWPLAVVAAVREHVSHPFVLFSASQLR